MSQETNDKRFVKEWEEQRKGSPVGFFILYTLVWAFIYYGVSLMYHLAMRTVDIPFIKVGVGYGKYLLVGLLITFAFYHKSQHRYYKIKWKQSAGSATAS